MEERPVFARSEDVADEPKRKSFSIVSVVEDAAAAAADGACFFDGCDEEVSSFVDVVDLRFPRGKATGSDMMIILC